MTLTFEGFKVHIDNQGYPRFWSKRLIMIHRFVFERAHGPIPPNMDIHHKDFNKMNWSLDNLLLISHPEHMQIHRKKNLADKGIDPETHAFCCRCKRALPHECFSSDSSRGDGISRSCKQCLSAYHKKYLETRGENRNALAREKYLKQKTDPEFMTRKREKDRRNARAAWLRKRSAEAAQ